MPNANGVLRSPAIAVDWDGTCVEGVWPNRNGEWLPGAVEGLHSLIENGWDVVIHTCRIAPILATGRWRSSSAVDREIQAIRRRLDDAGLSAVHIHTAPWKPNADVYLDDHGVRFTNWKEALSVIR